MPNQISVEVVATKILEIRGKKVMLDRDLARLYGVKTKRLNEQVRRNKKRFPDDFMFQLTKEEANLSRSQNATLNLRCQIGTLKQGRNIKYLPYVFTEQGVAMLSSVLNSERAIQVNILIMRAFTKLREILLTHKELAVKIEALDWFSYLKTKRAGNIFFVENIPGPVFYDDIFNAKIEQVLLFF